MSSLSPNSLLNTSRSHRSPPKNRVPNQVHLLMRPKTFYRWAHRPLGRLFMLIIPQKVVESSVQSTDPKTTKKASPPAVDPFVAGYLREVLGDAKWNVFSARLFERRLTGPQNVDTVAKEEAASEEQDIVLAQLQQQEGGQPWYTGAHPGPRSSSFPSFLPERGSFIR